jgi:hypothetical protein
MSITGLSNSELRALVRCSETWCDRAQQELDRRERQRNFGHVDAAVGPVALKTHTANAGLAATPHDFRHGHEAGPVAFKAHTRDAGPTFFPRRRASCSW